MLQTAVRTAQRRQRLLSNFRNHLQLLHSIIAKGAMSESQDVPAVSSQVVKHESEDSKEVYINLTIKQQVFSFPVTSFFLL
jgi:hypothetical protein